MRFGSNQRVIFNGAAPKRGESRRGNTAELQTMAKKKITHGGPRPGAGRKPSANPRVRITARVLSDSRAWLERQPGGIGQGIDRAVALAALAEAGGVPPVNFLKDSCCAPKESM